MVVDYATRYSKDIFLHNIKAATVARKPALIFIGVRFPKLVATDQGTSFMGETMQAMWHYMGVQRLCMYVYHPPPKKN